MVSNFTFPSISLVQVEKGGLRGDRDKQRMCLSDRKTEGRRGGGNPGDGLKSSNAPLAPASNGHDTKQSVMGWRRPCVTGYREAMGKGQWRGDGGRGERL